MESELSLKASDKYATVEALIRDTVAMGPIANSDKGRIKIYVFTDPAFQPYLLRTVGFGDKLANTTCLTPVEHIFHGPNIGAPLIEGRNATERHLATSNVSIMVRQPGSCITTLLKNHGREEVLARLALKRQPFTDLFRTTALLGAFEKSFDGTDRIGTGPREKSLDIHGDNIMLDERGTLGLIDQMTFYDTAHRAHSKLDLIKAKNSILNLKYFFEQLLGKDQPELQAALKEAYQETRSLLAHRSRGEAELLKYLQSNLPSFAPKEWRGIEAVETPTRPANSEDTMPFARVTSVEAGAIPLHAKPQELLNALNELYRKSVVAPRACDPFPRSTEGFMR